jgi:hypothetical protein
VWFLPDIPQGEEVRSCTIPADKAILFPIESGECNYGTDIKAPNEVDLRKCAMVGNEGAAVSASIDGRPVINPAQYRVQSGFFDMTIPKDNFIQNNPGIWKTFVDGYWIFVKPLSLGRHTIEWRDSISSPVSSEYNHAKHIIYNIMVKP